MLFPPLTVRPGDSSCDSAGKESICNEGHLSLIPGLGRSPGKWEGYRLQYSGLENSMDCIVHGITKRRTQLSNFHFHYTPMRGRGLEGVQLWVCWVHSLLLSRCLCVSECHGAAQRPDSAGPSSGHPAGHGCPLHSLAKPFLRLVQLLGRITDVFSGVLEFLYLDK